jgi:hypothetical protein
VGQRLLRYPTPVPEEERENEEANRGPRRGFLCDRAGGRRCGGRDRLRPVRAGQLADQSTRLFGFSGPLEASSTRSITKEQAQADPSDLAAVAKSLRVRVVSAGVAPPNLDQSAFWPSAENPRWLITCNEEGVAQRTGRRAAPDRLLPARGHRRRPRCRGGLQGALSAATTPATRASSWGETVCISDGSLAQAGANTAVPEAQRFVQGSPAIAMPDNIAYQPGRGNWVVHEDADTNTALQGPHDNDLWDCLPDGADPDLQSDGCVRMATLNDLTAEWTGGIFDASGQHFYVSVQHNVSGSGTILDITGWK